jgi:predicted phage terminase large subunit-like protein
VNDAIVMIMQRLNAKDCAATAIELGFTHLNLPMEFEEVQRCRTPIFVDPRKQEGELLFPERFPAAEVASLKRAKGAYAWAGQYQQRPGPREGAYFIRDWFQRYRAGERPANLRIYGTSDYAVTADKGDYTVHRIWGVGPNGDIYLLGGWRGRTSSDIWIEKKIDLMARWKPAAWFGEGGVIRRAIEPAMIRRMRERQVFCRVEWLPSMTDKAARARGFQSRAAMGAVFVPEGSNGDAWIEELIGFPGGAFDDEVDAASLMGRALDDAHPATAGGGETEGKTKDAWGDDSEDGEGSWKAA